LVTIGRGSTGWSADHEAHEIEAALAAALGRHETALARLRRTLPSPPAAIVRELEAAEQELRTAQARRDTIRR
jgi:hypothetical protein